MFLSKIWFILIGLVAGVGMTAAFVAPRPADRRIEQLEGQRLDRAQYAAEQMLKTDAHRWIDYVAKLSRDVLLAESLDVVSRGGGEPRMVHETVKGRLRALVSNLSTIGLDTVAAVDAKGRLIARLGERENDYGESIAGAEVITDALRGYLSDDVWGAHGKLRRIAAAPVLSKARDRIVGVVYVGVETGKRLAELWKTNLGVDIAILLRKQVVSSTLPEAIVSPLVELLEERQQEITESKRTRPIGLAIGSDRLIAVAAPFAGQAAAQEAYYVLIGKKAPSSNPWALLLSTSSDDLRWGNFPWLWLGGGMLLIVAVGLFLQHHEVEGPVARLRKELQQLGRGDLQKLNDRQFPGQLGGVARDMNAALERFTHAPRPRSETSRKDMSAILDGSSTTPVPPSPSGFGLGSSGGSHPAAAAGVPSPVFPSGPPITAFQSGGAGALGATPHARLASPAVGAPSSRGGLSSFGVTPPPPPPRAAKSAPMRMMPDAANASVGSASMPALARPAPRPPVPPTDDGFAAEMDEEETTDAHDISHVGADGDEAHMCQVYTDYIATRQQCGESVTGLSLEKFKAKLDSNRQHLVAKYRCRTARFAVYVKDGKAAIKATPVRD